MRAWVVMSDMIVVIDDERTFDTDRNDVLYLRSVTDALAWFANWWTTNENLPLGTSEWRIEQVWFDHDLGASDPATVVADFIATLNRKGMLPIDSILIHSQNPAGAENLLRTLAGCASNVVRCTLPNLKEQA